MYSLTEENYLKNIYLLANDNGETNLNTEPTSEFIGSCVWSFDVFLVGNSWGKFCKRLVGSIVFITCRDKCRGFCIRF